MSAAAGIPDSLVFADAYNVLVMANCVLKSTHCSIWSSTLKYRSFNLKKPDGGLHLGHDTSEIRQENECCNPHYDQVLHPSRSNQQDVHCGIEHS